MKIKVRLFATLRRGRDKEVWVEKEAPVKVDDLITALDIPEDQVAILLLNGRDTTRETPVKEGDVLSIFPPVGGG